MIQNKLTLEQFKQYNFIFYEQSLFRNLLSIFDDQKIKYKLLAINLFKNREVAPVLIDINSMSQDLIADFYHEIYLKQKSDFISAFDHMGLVQNLIKTELEMDELAQKLTELMLVNQQHLFRFYDPRILVHIFILNNRNAFLKNIELKTWILSFQTLFKQWCITLWGGAIIFDQSEFAKFNNENIQSSITMEYFEWVNQQVRGLVNQNKLTNIYEIVSAIETLHIELEKPHVN